MSLEALKQEVHTAWRGLRRARGFTAVAVLTLTIGVAATTLMFALIQSVLLRPFPVNNQDQLIVAWKELRSSAFAHYPFGGPDVEAVAETSQLVEAAAGVTSNGAGPWVAVQDGHAAYVNGALVTGGFFDVLGIQPVLGRALTRGDDVEGAEPVVVISHALWQRRYGGSRDVIGQRLVLGGVSFTIVGVTPQGLSYPRGAELWRTVKSVANGGPFGDAARYEVDLIARMRPGVTIQQVTGELRGLSARLESTAPPDFPRGLVPIVRPFEDVLVGDVRGAMLLLFAAVGLVLLISSANAANLLLMRSEARRRELAVRSALGAGPGRIASQLLAESALLAVAAGAVGLGVAWVSLGTLRTVLPAGLPRVESVHIDERVVLFTIGTAFVTALLTGVVPALSSARADLIPVLRSTGGRSGAAGRRALVCAQVALAVMVVALAGLLTRSLLNLRSADMGLSSDRLVFVDLHLPLATVSDRTRHEQFLEELMRRLQALPFISAATPINVPPFSGNGGWDVPRFTAEGQTPERAATNPSLNLESVHHTYFETFGITILRGRSFTPADRAGAPAVAIVSGDVAARTWPGEDPLGKRLKMGGPASEYEWCTVVGIAAPTRYRELENQRATLYLPAAQFLMTAGIIVVRSTAPVDTIASAVRGEVPRVDPGAQVVRVTPFTEMLDVPLARARFSASILVTFAASALLLATVGLYGVLAAHVRQRSRELGIRIALGASIADVRRIVLLDALRLSGAGAAVGLAGSAAAARLVRSLLYGLDPLDPLTLAIAALALIAASTLAACLPMRRAARVDPATLLRAT